MSGNFRVLCLEAHLLLDVTPHPNVAAMRFIYPQWKKQGGDPGEDAEHPGDSDDSEGILVFMDLVKDCRDLKQATEHTDLSLYGGQRKEVQQNLLKVSWSLAEGLLHLHKRCPVLHFDIKPANGTGMPKHISLMQMHLAPHDTSHLTPRPS